MDSTNRNRSEHKNEVISNQLKPPRVDIDSVKREVSAREGAECIYQEKILICHARIDKISVDDRMFKCRVVDLQTPGFVFFDSEWEIGSTWEDMALAFRKEYWGATYGGWTLYFNPTVITALIELAGSVAVKELLARYKALSQPLDDYVHKLIFGDSKQLL
jgi:hypothetical protein